MLTTDQVEQITVDFMLGRELSITGKEADEFRTQLAKDIKKIEDLGGTVEVPFEIPDID